MTAELVRSVRLPSIVAAIGNTPLVRLTQVARHVPGVEIYLKLEYTNPGGSVKDRPARRMVLAALESGELGAGKTLIDATSGNTGLAYSMLGAALGFPVCLVMPQNVTQARKNVASAFGAQVIYSDPLEGTDGAIRLVRELTAADPGRYFYPDQYGNQNNPLSHYEGTGAEILDALGDKITHFVAGIGTSGTLMGTSRRLHEHHRPIRCIGMQPDSALHGLEGLKHLPSSIVPAIYDESQIDETLFISTDDGWDMSEKLASDEGLHVGHSSGANVAAAVKIAERLTESGTSGCVVTIACDRSDRYFAPQKWDKRHEW